MINDILENPPVILDPNNRVKGTKSDRIAPKHFHDKSCSSLPGVTLIGTSARCNTTSWHMTTSTITLKTNAMRHPHYTTSTDQELIFE